MRSWQLGVLAASLSLAACTGTIGLSDDGSSSSSGDPPVEAAFNPGEVTMHRLTAVQVQNSWRALFGEPLAVPTDLPADDQLFGFSSISASGKTISPLDAEKYEAASYAVIEQVWNDDPRRQALVGCAPSSMADACVRSFVERFAERAWRRPVAPAEVDTLLALGTTIATDLGGPWEGLRYTLAAVLQSPHFLFRVEVGEPDAETGLSRYTSWEMASRLSYLLLDAPPTEQLIGAARADALREPAQIEAMANLLLEDPRARRAMVRFFRDFMNIGRLDVLDKNVDKFPQFTATLGPSMRVEIERMFESTVFERGGDFRTLFTTRDTYVNGELARLYGIEGIEGTDWVPVTLPDDGRRAGLLTTAGYLAMNAHKSSTSPTHRGRFVRIALLCGDVPPPPPGIDTTLPEPVPGEEKTMRERLSAHMEDSQCRGCHAQMDPIGFGLEHFDALGQWRDTENGLAIDDMSDVDGVDFEGGVELGRVVATLPEVGACIARRFYQHANGRLDTADESVAVSALVDDFVTQNHDFKALVRALVTNDGFRYASTPAAE